MFEVGVELARSANDKQRCGDKFCPERLDDDAVNQSKDGELMVKQGAYHVIMHQNHTQFISP